MKGNVEVEAARALCEYAAMKMVEEPINEIKTFQINGARVLCKKNASQIICHAVDADVGVVLNL